MTNAHSDENPFESWREEIRSSCDELREKLSDIRGKIESERQHQESLSDEKSRRQEPEMLPTAAETVVATTDSEVPVEQRVNGPDMSDTTEDRLQYVRRQLQDMLNATSES